MSNFQPNRRTQLLDSYLVQIQSFWPLWGQKWPPKWPNLAKKNHSTKIALVYLCLCQIFSQIEEPKFWTEFWPKMAKIRSKWPNLAKKIISLKYHQFTRVYVKFSAKSKKMSGLREKWAVLEEMGGFRENGKFKKKAAVLCFLYFGPPTSYQISEKSLQRFLR